MASSGTTTYSVWDYASQRYAYYQAPGDGATHAGSPTKTKQATALGATPEQAAWKVPPGAVKTGDGLMPIGRIASFHTGAPALGDVDFSSPTTLLVIAGIAYLAWRHL